jgi:hypothetical protein
MTSRAANDKLGQDKLAEDIRQFRRNSGTERGAEDRRRQGQVRHRGCQATVARPRPTPR